MTGPLTVTRSRSATTPAATLVLQPLRQPALAPRLLASGSMRIGADPSCDICIPVAGVADRHAVIVIGPQRAVVRASDPRTWINDGPVKEAALRIGDRLAIGPVVFQVRAATADEILEQLPSPDAIPAVDDSPPTEAIATPPREPIPEVNASSVTEGPSTPQALHAPVAEAESTAAIEDVFELPPVVSRWEQIVAPSAELTGEWLSRSENSAISLEGTDPTPLFLDVWSTPETSEGWATPTTSTDNAVSAASDIEALVAERLHEERRDWEDQRAAWAAAAERHARDLDARERDLVQRAEQQEQLQQALQQLQDEQADNLSRWQQQQDQWQHRRDDLVALQQQLRSERVQLEQLATQVRAELAAEAARQAAAWRESEAIHQRLTIELTQQFADVDARGAELAAKSVSLEAEHSALLLARSELHAERDALDSERARWDELREAVDADAAVLREDLRRQQTQFVADMQQRAQSQAELLAARQELQQERRRFTEQQAAWLEEREGLWNELSVRRGQLEQEFTALEEQHRHVGDLIVSLEREHLEVVGERERLQAERAGLAKARSDLAEARARCDRSRQSLADESSALLDDLLRQETELLAERNQQEQARAELQSAMQELQQDYEQFTAERTAWLQERDALHDELAAEREQFDAQVAALEPEREENGRLRAELEQQAEAVAEERRSLYEELQREYQQLSAVRAEWLQERDTLRDGLASERQQFDVERATVAAQHDGLASERQQFDVERAAVAAQREDYDRLRATLDQQAADVAEERRLLLASREQLATQLMQQSTVASAENGLPPAPIAEVLPVETSGGEDVNDAAAPDDSSAPASTSNSFDTQTLSETITDPPRSDITTVVEASSLTEGSESQQAHGDGLIADESGAHAPDAATAEARPPSSQAGAEVSDGDSLSAAASDADDSRAPADAEKPIVDSVNCLRAELARLFNMPEDSAGLDELAANAPFGKFAATQPATTASVAAVSDAPPEGLSEDDDWRSQLRSLVDPSGAETVTQTPLTESERSLTVLDDLTGPATPVTTPDSTPEHPKEEDSIGAYMERLLARTRRSSADGSGPEIMPRTTDEVRFRKPIRPQARSLDVETVDTPGGGPTIIVTEPLDLSYLDAAPKHQQDKQDARAKLQSFRHVANLSARTALAKHGWQTMRGELTAQALLAAISSAGTFAYFGGPLWGGPIQWLQGAGCLIAAGWTTRQWLLSIRRLARLKAAEKRKSATGDATGATELDPEFDVEPETPLSSATEECVAADGAAPQDAVVTAQSATPHESAASSPVE